MIGLYTRGKLIYLLLELRIFVMKTTLTFEKKAHKVWILLLGSEEVNRLSKRRRSSY